MDSLDSSSDFQFTQFLFQVLGSCSKGSNYKWYHCCFHVFLADSCFSPTLTYILCSTGMAKCTKVFFPYVNENKICFFFFWSELNDTFDSPNPREFCISFSLSFSLSHYGKFFSYVNENKICFFGQNWIIHLILQIPENLASHFHFHFHFHIMACFYLYVNENKIWFPGRNLVIHLTLQISDNFSISLSIKKKILLCEFIICHSCQILVYWAISNVISFFLVLFCASMKRVSVSFIRFLLLSHVQFISQAEVSMQSFFYPFF